MRTKPSISSRRTSAQWEHIVEQSKTTPLSLRAFCDELGVSLQSLYYWRSKVKAHAPHKVGGFTELTPLKVATTPTKQPEAAMELHLSNGRVVRITGGALDAQALRTLIDVAEAGGPC